MRDHAFVFLRPPDWFRRVRVALVFLPGFALLAGCGATPYSSVGRMPGASSPAGALPPGSEWDGSAAGARNGEEIGVTFGVGNLRPAAGVNRRRNEPYEESLEDNPPARTDPSGKIDAATAKKWHATGEAYAQGRGVERDPAKAAVWFRKAAEQGHARAQADLGLMLATGQGVARDFAEAMIWYKRAADQGQRTAMLNVGYMYSAGEGVPRDQEEAVRWYRRAAEQGLPEAQCRLGMAYHQGSGVVADEGQAAAWYGRAVAQGHPLSMTLLGLMQVQGAGVPQDTARGLALVRRAASLGDAQAKVALDALPSILEAAPK